MTERYTLFTPDPEITLRPLTEAEDAALFVEKLRQTTPLNQFRHLIPDWVPFRERRRAFQDTERAEDLGIIHASGGIVGHCAVFPSLRGVNAAEIAYEVLPKFRRHGHATTAVKSLAAFAITEQGFDSVEAFVQHGNAASERVLGKAGFDLSSEHSDGRLFRFQVPELLHGAVALGA